jgi:hypothetical protein
MQGSELMEEIMAQIHDQLVEDIDNLESVYTIKEISGRIMARIRALLTTEGSAEQGEAGLREAFVELARVADMCGRRDEATRVLNILSTYRPAPARTDGLREALRIAIDVEHPDGIKKHKCVTITCEGKPREPTRPEEFEFCEGVVAMAYEVHCILEKYAALAVQPPQQGDAK